MMKTTGLFWACAFVLLCVVSSQEELHAERYGVVELEVVEISLDQFLPMQESFQDVVSWHVSRFCKLGENNCWAEDKQIRRFDIVIQSSQTSKTNVNVQFYIRDRYDHTRAGLENYQVREAFGKYGSDISQEFGYDMQILSPEEPGMEGWMIAVITVSCVVGVALIITIIVLACKQNESNEKRALETRLIEDELRKDYSLSHGADYRESTVIEADAKLNPGYDSGSEKPSTSSSEHTGHGARNSQGPPPDYNGARSGHYDMSAQL